MSLDNLDTGKFVPVQVPRNRFKVLYQYIARPKYHGLRRTRNTFENSRSLVQQKRRSTVIVQITKPLISIYAVYQISIHLSKSTRCRTINDVSSPVYNTFKSKCVCVCVCLPENLWSNSPWIKCGWLLSLFSWSEKHFSDGFRLRHAFQIRSCINLFRENVVFFSLSHPMAELERAKPRNE